MADRIGVAPSRARLETQPTDDWFRAATNRFNIYSGTTNPTANDIPIGQWIIYQNTTTNTLRLWANWNGTVKGITLS